MNILVIGTGANRIECLNKFGKSHHWMVSETRAGAVQYLKTAEVVFDFNMQHSDFQAYEAFNRPVFINTTYATLKDLARQGLRGTGPVFGFCGFPTFLERGILEISIEDTTDEAALKQICEALNTEYLIVADRVGLVTPRVVCMIINEAYCTAGEGTASKEDIDLAMKLGTNYPYGPFEWCNRIGIDSVHKLLKAVYADTQDARYIPAESLQLEYEQTQNK